MCLRDKLKDAKNKIEEYAKKFRNTSLPPLNISGLYDLFPYEEQILPEIIPVASWPDNYPNADKKGVYLILDDELNILYIGKASMNNWLGNRLGNYFGYENNTRKCKVWHTNWTAKPRYVLTVGFNDTLGFEAPALEEFLLGTVETSDNTIKLKKGTYSLQ